MAKVKSLVAVLISAASAGPVFAAGGGDRAAWVGGGFGMSVPNKSNTSARPVVGVMGGAKIGSEFGVAAYYLSSKKDETINGVTTPWGYDLYGVMGAYYFEGEAKGVYLGGMLGMSKVGTKDLAGVEIATSPMHWGAVGGYDHMLMEHFSLGGELSYISIDSAATKRNSVSVTTDAFAALNFLVSAKVWF